MINSRSACFKSELGRIPGSYSQFNNSDRVEACLIGKSDLFTNIPNLVIELKRSMSANQLNYYKRRLSYFRWIRLCLFQSDWQRNTF